MTDAEVRATRVYGASDDLIEVEGEVGGEVSHYSSDDEAAGNLLIFSDGTLLAVKYGKPGHGGVWGITLIAKGALFDRIDVCLDEEADPYSDQAFFKAGLKWVYSAKEWELVR